MRGLRDSGQSSLLHFAGTLYHEIDHIDFVMQGYPVSARGEMMFSQASGLNFYVRLPVADQNDTNYTNRLRIYRGNPGGYLQSVVRQIPP